MSSTLSELCLICLVDMLLTLPADLADAASTVAVLTLCRLPYLEATSDWLLIKLYPAEAFLSAFCWSSPGL